MILSVENSTAANGVQVNSDVDLCFEDVGVVDLPFRVTVRVGGCRLFTSHESTQAEAKETRARMHAAYLEVHSDPKVRS